MCVINQILYNVSVADHYMKVNNGAHNCELKIHSLLKAGLDCSLFSCNVHLCSIAVTTSFREHGVQWIR